jgi:hypothetical protein
MKCRATKNDLKIKIMNIEEIKKELLHSDSQIRLFEITIQLNEEISKYHIELIKTKDELTKAEIKGKISLFSLLQTIVDKRIEDVRTREIYSNRRFRLAAYNVLKKATYNRIVELSSMESAEYKEQKAELKANKIE